MKKRYRNKNKKKDDIMEGYDENCKTCEWMPNCLGWDDRTKCKEHMKKYFSEHPEARVSQEEYDEAARELGRRETI